MNCCKICADNSKESVVGDVCFDCFTTTMSSQDEIEIEKMLKFMSIQMFKNNSPIYYVKVQLFEDTTISKLQDKVQAFLEKEKISKSRLIKIEYNKRSVMIVYE